MDEPDRLEQSRSVLKLDATGDLAPHSLLLGGPEHTLGLVRHLPLSVQILLGALLFAGGGVAGGKALFDLGRAGKLEATIAMFVAGCGVSSFGLLLLIGALVAL